MSSIHTNSAAMNALSTLRNINSQLGETQNRISTGFKVDSAKDNASYFTISETMKTDSSMYKAIDEGLTMTKNMLSTGRLGAENIADLAQQVTERIAFAQGQGVDAADVQAEIDELVTQINTTISQSTFNGETVFQAGTTTGTPPAYTGPAALTVVTGVSRATGSLAVTTMSVDTVDIATTVYDVLNGIDISTSTDLAADLVTAEGALSAALDAATTIGISEKAIETQQDFLSALTDRLDDGLGAIVDADMEAESARLQALQVQQQLATQSLSIANQAPQNILSLFR